MFGQKERPLELSDLASELNKEIIANPYKFLGLPDSATIAEVRQTFIQVSRRYHPDMIDPSFDSQRLKAIYTPEDFTVLEHSLLKELGSSPQDVFSKIAGIVASGKNADPQEQERRSMALKAIQAAAHEKMIQINTAYEAIKARSNPQRWNSPAEYEHAKQYNPLEKEFNQGIQLEANAELTLYPNAYEYWVPGAYLSYDWGPIPDHEWYEEEIFRQATVVKHLFVYKELNEGRQKISPVLLDTFFRNFELDEAQRETFTRLLLERHESEKIMEKLGIKNGKDKTPHLYALKFRRHVNEMLTLNTEPTWQHDPIEMRWEEGKLILKDYTETIFSEADVMLLSTLAYGPMLNSG